MSHRAVESRIERLLVGLRALLADLAREPSHAGPPPSAEQRFRELQDEAVAVCTSLRGAKVAAMQMTSAGFDAAGITRLVDLLERVERDSRALRPYAA